MIIQGVAKWAKVVGEPGWGYQKKHKEWSIDVFIDEETAHKLEVEGLQEKIKDKGDGQYITFKRRELKSNGEPNNPIRIVDDHGNAWPDNKKIGNGSVVNVNFATNDHDNGRSANILSLQVWDHVPFGDDFPVKTEDEGGDWAEDAA